MDARTFNVNDQLHTLYWFWLCVAHERLIVTQFRNDRCSSGKLPLMLLKPIQILSWINFTCMIVQISAKAT